MAAIEQCGQHHDWEFDPPTPVVRCGPHDGDECPRCESDQTEAIHCDDELSLVCGNCGYGT